jgi:hypothetical protein
MTPVFERIAASRHDLPSIDDSDRCAKLLAFIKTETRWQLLGLPHTLEVVPHDEYRARRRLFVESYAAARRRNLIGKPFYTAVSDLGAAFTALIAARRSAASAR